MSIANYLSNGTSVSQSIIQSRLSKAYKEADLEAPFFCECCGVNRWEHHDHTISQRMCKILHKTELIWDSRNWSYSCGKCHNDWESFKNGNFAKHLNFDERMEFLQIHDEQGYNTRKLYV